MGWPLKTLDELGHVSRGRSRHRPRDAEHLYGGPYPFIQTSDVKHANLYIKEFTQTYSNAGLAQSKLWKAGTLCITIAANIADTAILGMDACFPDSVIGFIPDPKKADSRFVKYLFDALLQKSFQQFTQGAAQDNLSQEKLLSLKFPTPSLRIQKRIADYLSAYDDLIENNRRRIQLLEQSARLLYKEWFVRLRFPGHERVKIKDGVPEGWRSCQVRDFVQILGGHPFKSSTYKESGKYGIVTIKNVHDSEFISSCSSFLNQPPENMKTHCHLSTGDILISLTGNIGRTCIVYGENYLLNQRVAKLVPGELVPPSFVYWTFSLREMQQRLENLAYGVAQKNLSPVQLGEQPFILPFRKHLILFDSNVKEIFSLISQLNTVNCKLAKARDLLLPRLMNGEIIKV